MIYYMKMIIIIKYGGLMHVDVISFLLDSEDEKKRLEFQIVLQCAPFLKGLKVACIINIDKQYLGKLNDVLNGTDMEYKVLMVRGGKCLVIFYRRREMSAYLVRGEVRDFLECYGYVCQDLDKVLHRLSARVCRYCRRKECFPHEIGAFLDYPIDDVRCFIEQNGRGEILSGYWKVYHNPGKARMIFLAYDKARISAVNEFLAGKPMRAIADCGIRDNVRKKRMMADECSNHRRKRADGAAV